MKWLYYNGVICKNPVLKHIYCISVHIVKKLLWSHKNVLFGAKVQNINFKSVPGACIKSRLLLGYKCVCLCIILKWSGVIHLGRSGGWVMSFCEVKSIFCCYFGRSSYNWEWAMNVLHYEDVIQLLVICGMCLPSLSFQLTIIQRFHIKGCSQNDRVLQISNYH